MGVQVVNMPDGWGRREALELEPRVTFCTIFFPNLELLIDEFARNSSVEISTFTQINPLPKTKTVVH